MIASIIIFIIAYFFIATEKIDKTIVAILGATIMLAFDLVPYHAAIEAIDLNVIFLIVGMMTLVFVLSQTGFFEWIAILLAKQTKGNPSLILFYLTTLTAVFSALLDNVTTVVLLAPLTILICQILEIGAAPFLILEIIASNIGGTATLIGDPPNIIIGSKANLSFIDFLLHLSPIAIIIIIAFSLFNFGFFKKRLSVSEKIKIRITEAIPRLAITNFNMMIKSVFILGLVMLAFLFHHQLHLKPGIIALGGASLVLLITKLECDHILMKVEWGVIFFLIGLFIMIAGLEHNGAISLLAQTILKFSGSNILLACLIILWGSAFFSSILDNIPFVISLVPLIKEMIPFFAEELCITDPALIESQIANPLWWSLALGACLGGNGTLIGASANIVVAHIGHKNKIPISFMHYIKYGFPYMILSLIFSSIYIFIRYFLLSPVS